MNPLEAQNMSGLRGQLDGFNKRPEMAEARNVELEYRSIKKTNSHPQKKKKKRQDM